MVASVRPADLVDAAALAELRWRWRVEERGETGMDHDTFVAAFTAWMAEHAGSHHAWLAEASAAPVGMAWLAVVNRVPGPGRWLRLSGNLQSVYVIPERRGAGVGRLLVDAAIAMARDSGIDYVSVHPSERSFPLYRRARFNDYPGVLELRWD